MNNVLTEAGELLINAAESARTCALTKRQFRRLVDRGLIAEHRPPGGMPRFRKSEVQRLAESLGLSAPAAAH